jgi:glycosyltransferase involved in cell wall biosynthesis
VKLAVVVQRYGHSISGGAELHARYVAEHLAHHAEVEVITTCAIDYVTWRNELTPGTELVNGLPVRRFPVARERNPVTFGRLSERVFHRRHSLTDELNWLESEGPQAPTLVSYIAEHAADHDFWIFFSFRYYHAYQGARAVPLRAVLVPTAERDPAVGLSMFHPIFRGVRALMYNSPEERAMIHAVSGNQDVPSVVVGVGSAVPADAQPARFRKRFNVPGPFAIYVGRIDENKGCKELFEFFDAYLRSSAGRLSLVLVGSSHLPIPSHPRIRYLGFLDDSDKFDAIAASELLIMPSYFESLSMVALEAWGLGRPVLANGRCDVLKGQCIRSGAGLYYDNALEFIETLRAIEHNRSLSDSLGRGGHRFFREHYDWPVIERKYLEMFDRLAAQPPRHAMEPLPGWLTRRTLSCPPSSEVVAALPAGPELASRSEAAGDPSPRSQSRPRPAADDTSRAAHDPGLLRPHSGHGQSSPREGAS